MTGFHSSGQCGLSDRALTTIGASATRGRGFLVRGEVVFAVQPIVADAGRAGVPDFQSRCLVRGGPCSVRTQGDTSARRGRQSTPGLRLASLAPAILTASRRTAGRVTGAWNPARSGNSDDPNGPWCYGPAKPTGALARKQRSTPRHPPPSSLRRSSSTRPCPVRADGYPNWPGW